MTGAGGSSGQLRPHQNAVENFAPFAAVVPIVYAVALVRRLL